jgi:aspartyl-tRNA(Asn)/glutamyl-tRNA(Gln) amidotransferase subunit A
MPTFGRVPKSGVVPLGYSLDHVGPLARSARDCAAVLAAIAGPDPADPDAVDVSYTAPEFDGTLDGVRIGVVRENHFPDDADPALAPAFDEALRVLAGLGATLVEVSLPYWAETITANYVTMSAEALAYHRADLAARWDDHVPSTRLALARGALATGADYVQAQRVRRVAQQALARLFDDVDLIAAPTLGIGAPRYDAITDAAGNINVDAASRFFFTPYWDAVGNPVLAAPMGATAAGLPLSPSSPAPRSGRPASCAPPTPTRASPTGTSASPPSPPKETTDDRDRPDWTRHQRRDR